MPAAYNKSVSCVRLRCCFAATILARSNCYLPVASRVSALRNHFVFFERRFFLVRLVACGVCSWRRATLLMLRCRAVRGRGWGWHGHHFVVALPQVVVICGKNEVVKASLEAGYQTSTCMHVKVSHRALNIVTTSYWRSCSRRNSNIVRVSNTWHQHIQFRLKPLAELFFKMFCVSSRPSYPEGSE